MAILSHIRPLSFRSSPYLKEAYHFLLTILLSLASLSQIWLVWVCSWYCTGWWRKTLMLNAPIVRQSTFPCSPPPFSLLPPIMSLSFFFSPYSASTLFAVGTGGWPVYLALSLS